MNAATWDHTRVVAPRGLIRPHNADDTAEIWESFDDSLARAVPFSSDLPVDRGLGRIAETLRRFPHERSAHPLLSFLAVGTHAQHLVDAQRWDWPLGPIQALADLDGHVLQAG
jgi:aminoglycoside 3-N-acetyltransferase